MKNLFTILTAIFLTANIFLPPQALAQSPEKMKYQAVARDNAGNILANQFISFRISILQGSSSGTSVYSETHQATTNDFGLANLVIGAGAIVSGNFTSIAWSADLHFLKVEMDPAGGTAFQLMGTSQLLSVPYALHAKTADSIIGNNSNSWGISGNAGTDPATNFIGTTDDQPLIFRVNNVQAGKISSEFQNSFYGLEAGVNTTGFGNTSNGFKALYSNTTGGHNTASGNAALYNNISGQDNTAIGGVAMWANISGNRNTAIGASSLNDNTEGSNNTATGYSSLRYNIYGKNNTTSGAYSLLNNYTGYSNTAIGICALYYNFDRSNLVAIGDSALYHNGIGATQPYHGWRNTAVGSKSLYSNTTGSDNTATGYQALKSNTTGVDNTASGNYALNRNTTGHYNTASGTFALNRNTTGHSNTASGVDALYLNTTGHSNTANGNDALYWNETGYENTAVGSSSLWKTGVGRNVGVGFHAGYNNITGFYNTAVGWKAGPTTSNIKNSTTLGRGAATTATNQIRIGNSIITSIGGYEPWTNVSDRRFKTEIREDIVGLDFIMGLQPVSYQLDLKAIDRFTGYTGPPENETDEERQFDLESRAVKEKIRKTGFIAQDVEQAAISVGYDFSGVDKPKNENDFYGLRYAEFVVPLVKGMQEQQEIIEQQAAELKAQNNNYEKLLKRVEELEHKKTNKMDN